MIRINLLPQAKKKAAVAAAPSGGGGLWAAVYLVFVVAWGVGLGVVYFIYNGELEEQKRQNAALSSEINELRQKSARLEEVRSQIAASQQLEEVVADLNRARTGPTRVMMEISQLLSRDGGPTIDPQVLEQLRRENPLAGFSRAWDVRRLWITSFTEDNRTCRIQGRGKTNEDVAEFIQRLALSELFEQVTLTRTRAESDRDNGIDLIAFELNCKVKY